MTHAHTTIATLLISAALAIGPTPIATAHVRHRYVAASERTGEWASHYDRCMRRCWDCRRRSPLPVADPYVPDDYRPQQVRPARKSRPSDLTAAFVGVGFLTVILLAIERRRNRRIARNCMRIASAFDREANRYHAEAIRRDPDL
jgi:hypothetical protein